MHKDSAKTPYASFSQDQSASPSLEDSRQPGGSSSAGLKKSHKALWRVLIIVAVLLVAGGASFVVFANYRQNASINGATGTLQQYCNAEETSNGQELYNILSTHLKGTLTVSDVQNEFTGRSTLMKIQNCTVSNIQINGVTATGTITITVTSPSSSKKVETSSAQVKLIQENGQWKIDQFLSTFKI